MAKAKKETSSTSKKPKKLKTKKITRKAAEKSTKKPVGKAAKKVKKKSPAKKAAQKKAKPKTKPKARVKAKPKPKAKPKVKAKAKAKVKTKAGAGTKKKGTQIALVRETHTRKRMILSKEDIDYFKRVLNEKRSRIVEKARDTLNEGMKLDEADLPDEYDMASSEYLQYFTLRLRGRERYFLDKIERALQRIDERVFGICEVCGEDIGMARLMARPETTLCIRCKETQEREERQFSE